MSYLLILLATTTGMAVVAGYDSFDQCRAASNSFGVDAIRNLPEPDRPGIFCVPVPSLTE